MIVRPVAARDFEAVRKVLSTAFPSSAEADLVQQLRADGDAAIELVAEIAGELVGHVLFSPVEAPFRALALAPLAVRPEHQRRGIGAALVEAGHEAARRDGWAGAFVLGDPHYYSRFGYSVQAARPFASPYAGPHFMLAELAGPLPVSGGEVRHARAFTALA
jgi:putative acetyltransferase